MTCFARRPTSSSTCSLLSLTSMWYIPLLMDPVSSASSQTTLSIPLCTNVLASSYRLLLSWSRLQPFNFAVGFQLCRQRQQPAIHQLGLVIQWGHRSRAAAADQRSTNSTISRFDLGLSWLEAQDPRIREVSCIATPETSDQRLGLHTSTCLATKRDSVCAASNPHRCLETRGVSLRCSSPAQPDRSSFRAPSLPTRRCPSAPASVFGRVALKSSSASSSLRVTNSACWFRLSSQLS